MNQKTPSNHLSAPSSRAPHLTSTDLDRVFREIPGEQSAPSSPAFLRCHSEDCFVATNEFDTAPVLRRDGDSALVGR